MARIEKEIKEGKMTYELAKELKDAGFPQKVWAGTRFYIDETSNERVWGDEDSPQNLQGIVVPTLSELIEACGEVFASLKKTPNGWVSTSTTEAPAISGVAHEFKIGSTPEEAVARLWLALNKKV